MKALKQRGMSLIPICGENFNGFLKQWRDAIPQGFNGYGTAELNWMAVVSLQLAVKAVNGEPVPSKVEVPLPEITNDNVSEWASDDLPDDYYPIPQVPSTEEIDTLIADALAKEGGATPAASPAATPAS